MTYLRGYSSAGRAPALHAGGQQFDPAWLHQSLMIGSFAQKEDEALNQYVLFQYELIKVFLNLNRV